MAGVSVSERGLSLIDSVGSADGPGPILARLSGLQFARRTTSTNPAQALLPPKPDLNLTTAISKSGNLVEPGLDVLASGIVEGRKAFGNVMKYLLMGTSSNFGNMFSMAGASLFLPFLPMLPTQILLNNFMYDLSQLSIPTDNVDDEYLRKPQHWEY
jgi:magnesium-transporting ATPase (P-type)